MWAQQYAVRFGMARRSPWRYRTRGPDFARVAGTVVDAGLDDDEREPGTDHRFRDLVMGNPLRPVVLRQPPAVVSIALVDESTWVSENTASVLV